jgi:gliding motility-associated-like protein
MNDTVYVDNQVNTTQKQYYYHVRIYDANDSLMGKSGWASSVRLDCDPIIEGINLKWHANVPWSMNTSTYPWHYVYRDHSVPDHPDEIMIIDSVNVHSSGFKYMDKGQFNGKPLKVEERYHYYVKTYGSYGNPDIPEPLINRSQMISVYPNDTIPPCTPQEIYFGNITSIFDCIEFMEDKPCDYREFYNEIFWSTNITGDCDIDNSSFNIYFSDISIDGPYRLIANVKDTFFVHNYLTSFAGCYRISSLDNSGNESEWSDPICHDNCPYYELPNVFTPNNDGNNDTFRAFDKPNFKCPRFVNEVHFRVYNRWGFEVFNSDNDSGMPIDDERNLYIDWDGSSLTGERLPSGTYYYVAEVYFEALDPTLTKQIYKGWVQLLK